MRSFRLLLLFALGFLGPSVRDVASGEESRSGDQTRDVSTVPSTSVCPPGLSRRATTPSLSVSLMGHRSGFFRMAKLPLSKKYPTAKSDRWLFGSLTSHCKMLRGLTKSSDKSADLGYNEP